LYMISLSSSTPLKRLQKAAPVLYLSPKKGAGKVNLLRAILTIIVLIFVYFFVTGFFPRRFAWRKKAGAPKNNMRQNDVMVKDPACGVYLPRSEAIRKKIRGEEHFFCTEECVRKFKKGPQKNGESNRTTPPCLPAS